MAVSIKDIARVANVSYSTVSRALNEHPRVSPLTRARVQQIAADMGYRPSAVARSLVTRRTNTIGVVATFITDPFFAEVIQAVEKTALVHGYSVILASSGGHPVRELELMRVLQERRVDGIILISGSATQFDLGPEMGPDIPIVTVNKFHEQCLGVSVDVDNHACSREATQHLIGLGHRRIAHIAGLEEEWDSHERQRGYQTALREAGLMPDPALLVRSDGQSGGGLEAMRQLLTLTDRPSAAFCYNDLAALGAMRAAHAHGLHIPRDLSVVGFDDIDLAAFFEPPLTTVAQPKGEMGAQAVDMLLELLGGEKTVPNCILAGRLVVRDSTQPPGAILDFGF